MNLLELESLRSELIEKTLSTSSNFLRLSLYQNYFDKILSLNNSNFSEAFLKEFIDDFISCITKYEVWGIEPGITEKLLALLNKLTASPLVTENLSRISTETDHIKKQYDQLNLILEGKDFEDGMTRKAFFPLIDREAPKDFYGIVESVTVRINKAVDADKFIIIPSEKEIENQILEQCKRSWSLALDLSKKYINKPFRHHEVIISFDKKIGFYEGNSLGIALTLSFLEQILKFYNPTYIINIKEQSAFTGGVNDKGIILTTGEEIIKQKVRAVFFSEINNFVIPKTEETYAYFALTQLKQKYPYRNLKLIPAEDIYDVINRRDLLDIKKQNLVVRGGKFVKKNWISAVVTVVLAVLFAYLFVLDLDDNPATFSVDGQRIYVRNKNGKELWKKNFFSTNEQINDLRLCEKNVKITDIDEDGTNEVLINQSGHENNKGVDEWNLLFCYDYLGNEVWRHKFDERVFSNIEELSTEYSLLIIDELNIFNQKRIYLIANNRTSFSSAIYSIDKLTGTKMPGILWIAGHTAQTIIVDYNNDEVNEIIALGWDNGYEDVVFFAYEPDTLVTARKSTAEYQINYEPADLLFYCRIPKTDFDKYYKHRTPTFVDGSLCYFQDDKSFGFVIGGTDTTNSAYGLKLNNDLSVRNVNIANDFRVRRDTLVVKGELKFPFTDNKEYREIIKDNILYWKNGKWINRYGLEIK